MTISEMKNLQCYGIAPDCRPPTIVAAPSEVIPPAEDDLAHSKTIPPQAPHHNGMSVEDVEALHAIKGMDKLHAEDALAAMHNRGVDLKQVHEKNPQALKNFHLNKKS